MYFKTYRVSLAGRNPRHALNEHAEGSVLVTARNRRHATGAALAEVLHHQHPVIGGVDCHEWQVTGVRREARSVR
jgi:hypothetical protein